MEVKGLQYFMILLILINLMAHKLAQILIVLSKLP